MPHDSLFTPVTIGSLQLSNRIVMAPLTRCRADAAHVPTDIMAEYYSQRASAGLIVAEATMVIEGNSAFGGREPGIYSAAQVAAWKKVTDAVHAKGGKFILQIWHGGRACHSLLNNGAQPVAPSPLRITNDETHTPQGKKPYEIPRELRDDELPGIVAGFRLATQNAKAAGFDGVEIHGANGYLLDEFLRDGSNQRSGPYGGPIANRARLLLEVVDACVAAWEPGRVGVRISPLNSYNDMKDSDPVALTSYVAAQLNLRKVAFLHIMRGDFFGLQKGDVVSAARAAFKELREKGAPKLLEPIMKVEVLTPDEYLGDVIGDLNSRRGQIQGTDQRGNAQVITAFVPLANMFGYVSNLRGMSQGRAQFTMQYDHYEPVPQAVADEVIKKYA